jgi:hypothetical protein
VPFFGSIDFWSSPRATEDVVDDNVEWDDYQFLVEEARY